MGNYPLNNEVMDLIHEVSASIYLDILSHMFLDRLSASDKSASVQIAMHAVIGWTLTRRLLIIDSVPYAHPIHTHVAAYCG